MSHSVSGYLKAFATAKEKNSKNFELTGDVLLVAIIPQDELVPPSKIIIADGGSKQVNSLAAKRPVLVRVLEVGPGYYNDDGTTTPCDVQVGDYLLVGPNSAQEISQYGRLQNFGRVTLAICNASERLIRWKQEEGFNSYFETLLSEVSNG